MTTVVQHHAAQTDFVSVADEVASLRAYAERHGLTTAQAFSRMDDPILSEMDEIKYFARTKGIPLAEAFILKGYR